MECAQTSTYIATHMREGKVDREVQEADREIEK